MTNELRKPKTEAKADVLACNSYDYDYGKEPSSDNVIWLAAGGFVLLAFVVGILLGMVMGVKWL